MGIVAGYQRMPPRLLAKAIASREVAAGMIAKHHPKISGHLYLDQSWHVMHFLLTGRERGGKGVLAKVLMGGNVLIPDDQPRGPAWYVPAEEVPAVAKALKAFPVAKLWKGFDQKKMDAAGIYYPSIDFDDAGSREYIEEYFQKTVAFFGEAASAGDAVIFTVSV